jgi:hypothetical protein
MSVFLEDFLLAAVSPLDGCHAHKLAAPLGAQHLSCCGAAQLVLEHQFNCQFVIKALDIVC